jgi:hypothetical protein
VVVVENRAELSNLFVVEPMGPFVREARRLDSLAIIGYANDMEEAISALSGWTPEQLALGKRWVKAWTLAARDLERIRRRALG